MFSKRLFNDGWEFSKERPETDTDRIADFSFERVNLPHDWLIYQTGDLYEDATGFYRKVFNLEKKAGIRYEIYFEGVYMDTTVYVNGKTVGEWKYGYSSFFFDITDELENGENTILVKVCFLAPNSRWYSGAGIYRDVYFIEHHETHIVTDSLYVSAKPVTDGYKITQDIDLSGTWEIKVSAEIAKGKADSLWNKGYDPAGLSEISNRVKLTLWFPMLGKTHSALIGAVSTGKSDGGIVRVEFTERVEGPKLWELEDPKLYDCVLAVFDPEADYGEKDKKPYEVSGDEKGKRVVNLKPGEPVGDKEKTFFGFRSFVLDNEKGFFINGRHIKLNGTCEHHDLGLLGAAFNKAAAKRELEILRGMGVNAIRTAHNMPAVGLLELTDEMGFIVMDESFDMWEGGKTEFDYGRFFKEWQERDVRSWIRRDRNHPCIFLWSIGNEIYDTHKDAHGEDITRYLQKEVRENDIYENAVIGIGSNYMPWQGAQNCADILKYAGYNYGEKFYDEHHKKHPDWFIFGSETSSTVQSRGIYKFPLGQSLLADDDLQCSTLGNCTTSWGAPNAEYCIIAERDHEFSMGQFLWSGFDYIGEPTPYHTRNSYFGQIDTAGFPKDTYYVYRSAWTDYKKEPFVHIFPYWDWNEGQSVDVRVASNAPAVELFVNGRSMGIQNIDHAHGKVLTGNYRVVFEKGEITAKAYDENGKEIAFESRHSFGDPVSIKLDYYETDKIYTAGCGDMAFIEVSVLDGDGYPVENANNLINVNVSGAGYLAGLDNGDSTDTDEYKGHVKRLFGGRMLVGISIGDKPGNIDIELSSEGLKGACGQICVTKKKETEGISLIPEDFDSIGYKALFSGKKASDSSGEAEGVSDREHELRVRRISLFADTGRVLTKDKNTVRVSAKVYPESALKNLKPGDLIWKVVTNAGIDSNIAKLKVIDEYTAEITAVGDGDLRVRCMTKCGCGSVKVISELDFTAEGIGKATLNPYDYIAGGLWSVCEGQMGNGNEHGVSTMRNERSVVGFENIDFGSFGSDEITLDLFVLSDNPFPMQIWEGMPGEEGSELLADVVYHKKMIWNVYQPDTYKLSRRIKGLALLSFVTYDKGMIKGFSFRKPIKAYELLKAGECDSVYGDTFEKKADRIEGIGNNVTVEFTDMDFGEDTAASVVINGSTDKPVNTIHLIFDKDGAETRDILEFRSGSDSREFKISGYTGCGVVRFVFLPGSSFDFASFRFIKQ